MRKITLDKKLCVRCGQCTLVCPFRIFQRQATNASPACIEGAEETCIACCHCVAACIGKAITIGDISADDCLEHEKYEAVRFENLAHLIRSRRSIRCYSKKPVEDRVIEQLLDVVRWAPTARNGLPVKWVIINGADKVKKLSDLVMEWIETQPGTERMVEAWKQGGDPVFRGAPCVIGASTSDTNPHANWAAVDTAIAVETLEICATAMRLGVCWAGIFVRAAQSPYKPIFNKWLGLSDTETIHGGLFIGHPGDVVYQRIPFRPEATKVWI